MPWETRPWTTTPNQDVLRATSGGRLLRKRVRLTLDPRSWDAEDANDLVIEGTVLACSNDGPTLILEETDVVDRGRIPLIDILLIQEMTP